ncbi:hypothetical protein [Brevibacillus choshinensis]|uniref:Uncharacterized protein n=1 Tax=Brevibacillus choshinensis TaxID=54911 RepID=A0ABX7FUT1_BRECH|nr:hypothetical protein [Brevibacillus choshinensis]QRG69500.1 hypothetical protein JNE38_10440 [Brevibacillus choshinensis]
MGIVMNREKFEKMETEELGRACIEPILHPLRGKDPSVKAQAYERLTPGQRALFMFHVLHDHACPSAGEFAGWLAYTQQEFSYWIGIVAGLRFYEQQELLAILEGTILVLEERNRRLGKSMAEFTVLDMDDDRKLREQITSFYVEYQRQVPHTLRDIGQYIRRHPNEFVSWEPQ